MITQLHTHKQIQGVLKKNFGCGYNCIQIKFSGGKK